MNSQQRDASQNMSMEFSSSDEDDILVGYEDVVQSHRGDDRNYSRETLYGQEIRERRKNFDNPKEELSSKEYNTNIKELEEKNKIIEELEERLEKSKSKDAKKIKEVEAELEKNKNKSKNSCNCCCQILFSILSLVIFMSVMLAIVHEKKIDKVLGDNLKQNITVEEEKLELQLEKVQKDIELAKQIEEKIAIQKNISSAPTAVQDKLQHILENIKVNKNDKEEYEMILKNKLVEYWKEESSCNLMKGIHQDQYQDFLKWFEKSLGASKNAKEIINTLEGIKFMKENSKMVKYFNLNGTDVTGRYGMIAVHKNYNDEIDVAFAVYSVDAKFVGGAKDKQNNYELYHFEQVEGSNGLFRKGAPLVEDVATGEMVKPDERFKQDDVSKLEKNFIVAKALIAFQQNGIIQNINYSSDQIEMDQIEEVENKSSK